jgi:uncharacterized membrane protein YkvI
VARQRDPLWYRLNWWFIHQPGKVRWPINVVFVAAGVALLLATGVLVVTQPKFYGDKPGHTGSIAGGLGFGVALCLCCLSLLLWIRSRERRDERDRTHLP